MVLLFLNLFCMPFYRLPVKWDLFVAWKKAPTPKIYVLFCQILTVTQLRSISS